MSITRSDANVSIFQAHVNGDGDIANVELTRQRPGVLTLTTPANKHVVVNHVPYYVDCQASLYSDGRVEWDRHHVVYRFGANQSDPVDETAMAFVDMLLHQCIADLRDAYADEVGVFAEDDVHALLVAELAQAARMRDRLGASLERNTAKASALSAQIASDTAQQDSWKRRAQALQDKIEAYLANPDTADEALAYLRDQLDS
ncbi:hypothetical protein LRP67_08220 [Nocardioides sp. cx-169]|uniref:hypothetical protein n=1 Tax=Nocardioides sp. cx-169 TaxID=2899080 RepID=UPI001E56D143|nr:hypothetical protein [Nocardioides sp. cx-169]MCD4534061.1 hypothetical protein [Nocardioides sp. cx-169]